MHLADILVSGLVGNGIGLAIHVLENRKQTAILEDIREHTQPKEPLG